MLKNSIFWPKKCKIFPPLHAPHPPDVGRVEVKFLYQAKMTVSGTGIPHFRVVFFFAKIEKWPKFHKIWTISKSLLWKIRILAWLFWEKSSFTFFQKTDHFFAFVKSPLLTPYIMSKVCKRLFFCARTPNLRFRNAPDSKFSQKLREFWARPGPPSRRKCGIPLKNGPRNAKNDPKIGGSKFWGKFLKKIQEILYFFGQ